MKLAGREVVRFVRILHAAALVAVTAVPAFGQVTGRVVGRVIDSQTGEPLVGGLVVVESTNLGNVTREDGSFFINDVPVGPRKITSEYLGYRAVTEARRILAGQTLELEFQMVSDMIDSPAIVAVVEREPWVPPPPERIVFRQGPPGADLPSSTGFRCAARAVLHGAYILNGRWELQMSVKDLACRDVRPAPAAEIEPPLNGIISVSSAPQRETGR